MAATVRFLMGSVKMLFAVVIIQNNQIVDAGAGLGREKASLVTEGFSVQLV
jgi:hypothetical protein